MEYKLFLVAILCLNFVHHEASSTEALLECGRIHQIDNIANHSSASASYSNSQCKLVCVIGNVTLAEDSVYEGQSCPEDATGICRAGQCIGGQENALYQCGLKHHLDFHKVDNQGTTFTNDQCTLRCVLGGDQLSAAHLHEGLPCPANANGVCRAGACVAQSTNSGTTVTPKPTTQPPIESFSPSKMKLLNISLVSTDPTLNQTELIYLYFYETRQSTGDHICGFYGDSTKPTSYNYQHLNDIPSKLNRESKLDVDLYDSRDSQRSTQEREDIYSLFANFYKNHKLAFGEKEDFVEKFPIYRSLDPHEKLMDVTLRFTVVFSE